jgi:hypothetical protein
MTYLPGIVLRERARHAVREIFVSFFIATGFIAFELSDKPHGDFFAALLPAAFIGAALCVPLWLLCRLVRFALGR